MYRQPLNRPRIPQRTAPSHLGDVFFLPIFNPVPEKLFPGRFFVRAGKGRAAAPFRKLKGRLAYPSVREVFLPFGFHSPFRFHERGFFLPVSRRCDA